MPIHGISSKAYNGARRVPTRFDVELTNLVCAPTLNIGEGAVTYLTSVVGTECEVVRTGVETIYANKVDLCFELKAALSALNVVYGGTVAALGPKPKQILFSFEMSMRV